MGVKGANLDEAEIDRKPLKERIQKHLKARAIHCCSNRRHRRHQDWLVSNCHRHRGRCKEAGQQWWGHVAQQ